MDLIYINISDAVDLAHSLGFRNMHGNEIRAKSVAQICYQNTSKFNARKRNRWEIDWLLFVKWLSEMNSNQAVVVIHECIRNNPHALEGFQVGEAASVLWKAHYGSTSYFDELDIDWHSYNGGGPLGIFQGFIRLPEYIPGINRGYIEVHHRSESKPSGRKHRRILLGPPTPWCRPYMRALNKAYEQNKKEIDNETT